jgi:hypothetical protein
MRGDGYRDYDEYSEYDASWSNSTSYISSDDEFASPYTSESGGARRPWMSGARDRAAHMGERASEIGAQARERARQTAMQARSRWGGMMNDNPMALGIAALAAGALVGAALPRTETENQYLGETRDSLVESARAMAHDSVDSAREAAKETISKVTGSSNT